MELKDFVSQVITEICLGIEDAKEKTAESGALVCPPIASVKDDLAYIAAQDSKTSTAALVYFDVALTVSSSEIAGQDGQAKGKLSVLSFLSADIGMNGTQKNEQTEQTVSRVRFTIPVKLSSSPPDAPHSFSPLRRNS